MPSLLALPVEVQLEILTRCTYGSLKQLQGTCREIQKLVLTSAALDGILFRTKTVDVAELQARKARRDVQQAAVEKARAQEKKDGKQSKNLFGGYRTNIPDAPLAVKEHHLLSHFVVFGTAYEEHSLIGAPKKDDKYQEFPVHKLSARLENATEPPTSTLLVMDDRSGLWTENMAVSKVHNSSGRIAIRNPPGQPVTVEQFLRNYFYYAREAIDIYYEGDFDSDHRFLEGWGSQELRADGTLVLDHPFYGS